MSGRRGAAFLVLGGLLAGGPAASAPPVASAPQSSPASKVAELQRMIDTPLPPMVRSTAPAGAEPAPAPGPAGTGAVEVAMLDRTRVGSEALVRGRALQPRLRFDGVTSGWRRLWDGAEPFPPLTLKVGDDWSATSWDMDLTVLRLGTMADAGMTETFGRRGCVYYHDLPIGERGRPYLLHRYLYFFPRGRAGVWSNLASHVVWVEVKENLAPTAAELDLALETEKRRHQAQLADLERLAAQGGELAGQAREALTRLAAAAPAAGRLPARAAIERVTVSDPVPALGGTMRLRTYRPDQLEFLGDRPELWVAGGTHRLLAGPGELGWFEHCDAPWIFEPGGILPLVDLRAYDNPENPLATRVRALATVPELPGFIDHPALVFGFEEAARRFPDLVAAPAPGP